MVEKIIYTNGILTDATGAAKTADQIEQITGIETEVFHNGAAPLEKVGTIAKNILVGAYKVGSSFFGSGKEGLREEGLKSLLKAASSWVKMQKAKSSHAKELAGRVEAYLNEDPNRQILLIFHSQGAHVGLKALKRLKHLKGRIEVVTIGGMVHIPDHMANRVTNLAFSNDPVNWIAKLISGSSQSTEISHAWAHCASDYLNHHKTKEILQTPKAIS